MTQIKICGLSEPETLEAALVAGANFSGFVFYAPSPRFISDDVFQDLSVQAAGRAQRVGLFVDPADEDIEARVAGLDMIQLHGDESVARIGEIKERFGLPVIKAFRIRTTEDFLPVSDYESCVDWLLFDSRPSGAHLPGGTGQSFDWDLLEGHNFSKSWMLSGGLTPDNVGQALSVLKPAVVDVSSGVESAPGVKDTQAIRRFIKAVRA